MPYMLRMRLLLVAAITILALPAAAIARTPLDLTKAESVARTTAHDTMDRVNADEMIYRNEAATADPAERAEYFAPDGSLIDADPLIVRAGFLSSNDGCDQETAFRAVCDVTYVYETGAIVEESFDVISTRKGGYRALVAH